MEISLSDRVRAAGIGLRFGSAIALASLTTAVIALLGHLATIPNISLLYLPGILTTAVYFGTGPSLTAAVLSALEYDFFLLRPAHTLTIAHGQDVLDFVVFILIAVISSQLAAGARARTIAARRQAMESASLHNLAESLIAGDIGNVLNAITRRVVDVFEVALCAIYTPVSAGGIAVTSRTERTSRAPDRAAHAAAQWAFEHGTEISLPLPTGGKQLYIPLRTGEQIVGVMEIGLRADQHDLEQDAYDLVTNFAAQAALLIARNQAVEETRRLRVVEESDRLKTALLSSLSHDLRTPLAAIKASATSLLEKDVDWTGDERDELLRAIDSSADRLNRLVGNLLDLSRIEAGVLQPVLELYTPTEIVETIVPHLRPLVRDRPFEVDVDTALPPIPVDLVRLDQLLVNLVENAVRYTPAGSPIEFRLQADDRAVSIAVADHGPGIARRQGERIFETFFRGQPHGDRTPGTGLGLAICRGIARAHDGTLVVEDTPGGGATFVLTLPLPAAEPVAP